ncbi:hypothetical protein BDQ17DRAFT_1332460 [Cyathus striatus]|nr:hypothetical protein BDQ17DRAFT_1332460 [Cyathus striatus]
MSRRNREAIRRNQLINHIHKYRPSTPRWEIGVAANCIIHRRSPRCIGASVIAAIIIEETQRVWATKHTTSSPTPRNTRTRLPLRDPNIRRGPRILELVLLRPNPKYTPIGSSGTIFHIQGETPAQWKFEIDTKDVVSSPIVVALVQLANVEYLGDYEDIVGKDGLVTMFGAVNVPQQSDSRTWFLDGIGVLHDCGVVTCDDVWLLEREIKRMDSVQSCQLLIMLPFGLWDGVILDLGTTKRHDVFNRS